MSWPSTRLRTVTVLNAVTVPRPLKYTGRSPRWAVATTTGTTNPPPAPWRPCPLPPPPGAPGPCASVLVRDPRKYQKPTAMRTAKATTHTQRWPFDPGSRPTGRSPEGIGPGGLALKWPIHMLLYCMVMRASVPLARHSGETPGGSRGPAKASRKSLLIPTVGRLAGIKGYEGRCYLFSVFGDKSACTNGGWTVHYRAFGCFPAEQSGNLDVTGGGSTHSCGSIGDHVQGLRNRNTDRCAVGDGWRLVLLHDGMGAGRGGRPTYAV